MARAPDVAGRGGKGARDGDDGAGAGDGPAAVRLVEDGLGGAGQREVVVARGEGARDGVVKRAVEAAVRVGGGDDGVEADRRGEAGEGEAVVGGDGGEWRRGRAGGGGEVGRVVFGVHAEEVDGEGGGLRHDGRAGGVVMC